MTSKFFWVYLRNLETTIECWFHHQTKVTQFYFFWTVAPKNKEIISHTLSCQTILTNILRILSVQCVKLKRKKKRQHSPTSKEYKLVFFLALGTIMKLDRVCQLFHLLWHYLVAAPAAMPMLKPSPKSCSFRRSETFK